MTDLDAFLRWQCGPLVAIANRTALAEWLVHRALGLDPGEHRREGADLELPGGPITLAVRSAAYLQSAQQTAPTAISFPMEQRTATAYVFCLLAEQDPARVNPQDLAQWRFWLVPTRSLHAERQSIGLQPLIRAHGEGMAYEQLGEAVEGLAQPDWSTALRN
ncbi:MAG: hypothetical protein VKM34_08660 [Cyanobacteriota bacterium]|uniref:hypothetical protein n=1 Tax=Cyanobium sp. FACHB-13342 TaxID=2692793 RepID=UPI001681B058|nr:hypothetical protein [Cyanobium sp. FACHB-13342]MBD2423397.1 hypothetical protein [Cyanobium sp. FACHB-13342]MEB3354290.1 hypothetical protein [Cyanobacteriota bacterium]